MPQVQSPCPDSSPLEAEGSDYMMILMYHVRTCDHHTDLRLKVFFAGIAFEENVDIANHRKRCNVTLSVREDDKR